MLYMRCKDIYVIRLVKIPDQVPSEFESAMLPMTTVFHLVKDSLAWYKCLRAENPLLQLPLKDLILEYFQCHL